MHSPPYPNAHLLNHTLHGIYKVPISKWLAGNKWHLQVCTNVHTGSIKRRVIAITQNGDLTKDVSTWSSTYIKTLTNKEKFQH